MRAASSSRPTAPPGRRTRACRDDHERRDAGRCCRPTWSDPRVHLLDDTWLLTIFAILLATALPWLMSAFDIDFVAASLGLLALGAIHIALHGTASLSRTPASAVPLLTALHVAGVLIVGFIWMHAGGLQNPAFLMVFALPVVGAIFLSRWQPYLMALLAIVLVGAVALAQAPELRWYAPGLNTVGAWLATALRSGQRRHQRAVPPASMRLPATSWCCCEVFAILVFACAVAAEYLGTIFERLHAQVDIARAEAERGQEFWATLIEELPHACPAGRRRHAANIVCASEQASRVLRSRAGAVAAA